MAGAHDDAPKARINPGRVFDFATDLEDVPQGVCDGRASVVIVLASYLMIVLNNDLLAHRVSVSLSSGSVMLALALITVIALVVRPLKRADVPDVGGLAVGTTLRIGRSPARCGRRAS